MEHTSEWFGGKPGGSVGRSGHGWHVRFQNPYARNYFSGAAFGGEVASCAAARAYQVQESLNRKQTRNRTRVVQKDGEIYLEIELQDGRLAKCDLDDSALVERRTWSSWKSASSGIYYVAWSGGKDGVSERFHRLVHPEWAKVDHINRDGLDNRRRNLRDGGGGVNERNAKQRADNSSGVTGVSYSVDSKAWVVQWSEGGRRRMKRFPGAKDDEAAKERAIGFRRETNARTGNLNGT